MLIIPWMWKRRKIQWSIRHVVQKKSKRMKRKLFANLKLKMKEKRKSMKIARFVRQKQMKVI